MFPVALVAVLAACGGGDDADIADAAPDSVAVPTGEAAAEPGGDTVVSIDIGEGEEGSWVALIGSEVYLTDPELTICIKIPGGSFAMNGAGTHPTQGRFEIYVSKEDGGEMSFELSDSEELAVVGNDGGDIEVEIVDGNVGAGGSTPNGDPFTISGTC